MGFYSYKCAKSGVSIPAFPYAQIPMNASDVVMVLPDNSKLTGIYDGYGRINGVEFYPILESMVPWTHKNRDAQRVEKDGETICHVLTWNWETPIPISDILPGEGDASPLIGKTKNQLKDLGYEISQHFYAVDKQVKIVRSDHYNGESFNELPASENCPDQGFFYERETICEIVASLDNVGGAA